MKDYQRLFLEQFHHDYESIFFSPGRVNLIGEHIDYLGGHVFPAAIHLGTYGILSKRDDQKINVYSTQFEQDGIKTMDIHHIDMKKKEGWLDYIKGVLVYFNEHHYSIKHGFNLYIDSDLPIASGLSSSASLEVLIIDIINDLFQYGLTKKEIALIGQEVENHYLGMHCGIMDQLSIACGKKDKAMLMDTKTLDITYEQAMFEGYTFLIMNTNYKRKTTESKYNERVLECQMALTQIQSIMLVQTLCELKEDDLPKVKEVLTSDVLYQRVKHAVTEEKRTHDALAAMNQQDPITFGKILDQSHQSLKVDYEVTGIHLDSLVGAAKKAGALGARVTGAGFGGCAIALLPTEDIDASIHHIHDIYVKETGIKPDFYRVTFVDGVGKII